MSKVERPAKVNTEHEWVGAAWAEKAQLYMDQLEAELAAERERCLDYQDAGTILHKQLAAERERIADLIREWDDIEARSAEAHHVYQIEAHQRGDVRHPDFYSDLSESTKEWDRVLVRWIRDKIRARFAAILAPKDGADE